MLNNVIINQLDGGLDTPLAGEDFVSGYIHYTTALPSGFSANDRIKQIFSVSDAENLGITNTSIGETRGQSTLTITVTGSTNDTLAVNVITPSGAVSLGTYTKVVSDNSLALVATGVANVINSGNLTHGFSASTSAATITVKAPIGSGVGGNSYTYANLTTGTISATTSTFTGGIASQIDIIWYQISEFFRAAPQGELYVGIYSGTTNYAEVVTLQSFATGRIRQIGVYTQSAWATNDIVNINTQAVLAANDFRPLSVIYQGDMSGISDLTTLTDLHQLNSQRVSGLIGQDGNAQGQKLWLATNKTIGMVGITLGSIAASNVNWSLTWTEKFNVSAVELETPAFGNGVLIKSVSTGLLSSLDSKGYMFLRKFTDYAGTYFNETYTATLTTSDFKNIQNNRVLDKASRTVRKYLLPALGSPTRTNTDGTLTLDTVSYFKTRAQSGLDVMASNAEISAQKVTVNAAQNVVSTGVLTIGVAIQPVGYAKTIVVNLAYTLSVA